MAVAALFSILSPLYKDSMKIPYGATLCDHSSMVNKERLNLTVLDERYLFMIFNRKLPSTQPYVQLLMFLKFMFPPKGNGPSVP